MSTKKDPYLIKFINYCKDKFKDNLIAIVIYGSYAWGYFDKRKSDYDLFVIFKNKIPRGKSEIRRKFKRIALPYFCTTYDLINKIKEGHFAIHITLLKSAKVLYKTKNYDKFLKKLKKIDFLEELVDIAGMESHAKFEKNVLKKRKGFMATKWALHTIRKRLQLLTYIRYHKLIWDLEKILPLEKDILNKEEKDFLLNLEKKLESRSKEFSKEDKNIALKILHKLDEELFIKLLSPIK